MYLFFVHICMYYRYQYHQYHSPVCRANTKCMLHTGNAYLWIAGWFFPFFKYSCQAAAAGCDFIISLRLQTQPPALNARQLQWCSLAALKRHGVQWMGGAQCQSACLHLARSHVSSLNGTSILLYPAAWNPEFGLANMLTGTQLIAR